MTRLLPPSLLQVRQRAASVRSWAVLVCALVLMALAGGTWLLNQAAGWTAGLRLLWIVTAVLGTWLSARTAILARGAGGGGPVVLTGWALAVAGAMLLVVDVAPMLRTGRGGPAGPFAVEHAARQSSQRPVRQAALIHEPRDGERDVAPDEKITIAVEGASFANQRVDLWLSSVDEPGPEVVYDCERGQLRDRRLYCSARVPLQPGRTYRATFKASLTTTRGTEPVELSWSFTTAMASAGVRGVVPGKITLAVRSDRDIEFEGAAGAVPEHAVERGWTAVVHGDDTYEWPIAIGQDGSLRGILPTSGGRRLKDTRDLHLELLDDEGGSVVRLLLDPITADEGRAVRLVRGRPVRWTAADGVVVEFDGTMPGGKLAWITVEPAELGRCRKKLPPELGWGGAWEIDSRVDSSKPKLYHEWSPRDKIEGPPLVDLLFPAPPDAGDDMLAFDVRCVNTGIPGEWSTLFLLRDVGSVETVAGARYFRFRRSFAVAERSESCPGEIAPGTVYDQPLDGKHLILWDRNGEFALVVGDYSGRNWIGDFVVNENSLVRDSLSTPYLAAPLPAYGTDAMTHSNRTLAIVPVRANHDLEFETRHTITGWLGSRLELPAVQRRPGEAFFVGDLDALTAAQQSIGDSTQEGKQPG